MSRERKEKHKTVAVVSDILFSTRELAQPADMRGKENEDENSRTLLHPRGVDGNCAPSYTAATMLSEFMSSRLTAGTARFEEEIL